MFSTLEDLARKKILEELHRRQILLDQYDWAQHARPSQLPPSGNWYAWCILAGRGFGKTRAGAETIREWATTGIIKRIALIGNTFEDIRNVMIEGQSGLLRVHPPNTVIYNPSTNTLRWKNGCLATAYSAEAYESLRGPQFDCAWIDELCKFSQPRAVWDQLMFSLRLSDSPKVVITTTPRPIKLLSDFFKDPRIVITQGSTYENQANLSKVYIENLQQYSGTALEKQEIRGELLDLSGLWKEQDIQYWPTAQAPQEESNLSNQQNLGRRLTEEAPSQELPNDFINPPEIHQHAQLKSVKSQNLPKMKYTIVGLDPAATSHGDETGIVTVGIDDNRRIFVLDDVSGHYSPATWAEKVREQYTKHSATTIVAKGNQGREMISRILRGLPVHMVHAQRSKTARATPVAMLYEQKRVHHVQKFKELERQLLEFESCKSPDRVDALVWAVAFLEKWGM